MPSEIVAKPRGAGAPAGAARWAAVPVVLLAVVLAFLATQGMIYALAAIGVAAYLVAVVVFGATRVGIATLMGCFLTAPAYKGLAPAGATVTPTDLLMVLGFGLLLPRVMAGQMRLPASYLIGGGIVTAAGLIATIGSHAMVVSALGIIFWLGVMMVLPIAVNMWDPTAPIIRLLCWSYVVGHLLSWGIGTALGHIAGGRYYGMTNHPNYFAEAGLMCVALLIYLFFQYDAWRARLIVVMFGAVCAASILMSGSRAATLVLAVLVVMIPIVERSAITGFLWAVGGAALIGLSPFLLNLAGSTASIDRLLGHGTAAGSDEARTQGLKSGIQMVHEKPIFGRGLITADLFDIHNNYLEVAVAVGIVGLIGYLLVLFAFARPLFEHHVHRRLAYTVWAYIGWGVTVPALYDRSIWVPLMLTAVCWTVPLAGRQDDTQPSATPAAVTGRS